MTKSLAKSKIKLYRLFIAGGIFSIFIGFILGSIYFLHSKQMQKMNSISLLSHGINPAVAPKILPNESTKLSLVNNTSSPSGWTIPQYLSWEQGFVYLQPPTWIAPTVGDGGCGWTITPNNDDVNKVWISICGPDLNGASINGYIGERILEEKNTTLNGTPVIRVISQSSNTNELTYFLHMNSIVLYASSTSQIQNGGLWISLTAPNLAKLNQYESTFEHMISTAYFATSDQLSALSQRNCLESSDVLKNQIAQFEHAQYEKNVSNIFQIIDQRIKNTTNEYDDEDFMVKHLFKDKNLTYSLISYKPGAIRVYTPGMCQVSVQEERKIVINNSVQTLLSLKNFVFSTFGNYGYNNKWLIQGYYSDPINFSERTSGFYD